MTSVDRPALTKKDYKTDQEVRWCPGCGDYSILAAMQLASRHFGLDVAECLHAVTRVAARALGLGADRGTLEPGRRCDLALWEISEPAELVHGLGLRPLRLRWVGGEPQTMQ